jgi:hypothetical protein
MVSNMKIPTTLVGLQTRSINIESYNNWQYLELLQYPDVGLLPSGSDPAGKDLLFLDLKQVSGDFGFLLLELFLRS